MIVGVLSAGISSCSKEDEENKYHDDYYYNYDDDKDGGNNNSGQVPSAPTGLSVTQNDSYVYLSWNYNSYADHYVIYRSTSQYGSYSKIKTTSASSYSDYDVSNEATYYYKVTAANSNGVESGFSNVVSVTISTSTGDNNNSGQVPSAPTGLTATQAGPKAYPYVSLSWNSSNADHYVIYRSTSQYGSYSKIGSTYASSYNDEKSLSNGKTYYYKVTAANSSNKESGYSNVASVTINTTIVENPGIASCSVTKGTNQITIKWTYASSSGYSTPDQVRLISEDPTYTGLTDVFSWTLASSKKSHTVRAADLAYGSSSKNEYTLYLQVRNSAGSGKGTKIVWNWMNNTGYIMGDLCGYTSF